MATKKSWTFRVDQTNQCIVKYINHRKWYM